jgi:hypothetical protein
VRRVVVALLVVVVAVVLVYAFILALNLIDLAGEE